MKITKSRTIQIKQYEPMTITCEDESEDALLEKTNELLDKFMEVEVLKMEVIREGLK